MDHIAQYSFSKNITWNKKKLGEIASFGKGRDCSRKDLYGNTFSAIVYGELYTNYKFKIYEVDSYVPVLEPNYVYSNGTEVLVPSSGETAEEIARASHLAQKNVVIGSDINIIYPNLEEVDPTYLALYITYSSKNKDLARRAQGKSVVHLYVSDLKDLDIIYPDLKEQREVAYIFEKYSELIDYQTENIKKLIELKKSMLQKMFPKKGELVPEFRFDGYESRWNKRKISDIGDVVGGGTPSTSESNYWNGDINWYTPSEINNKIYYSESMQNITEIGLQKSSAKILPKNKTILFTSRATIGNLGILLKDGTTNQGFQNIVLNDCYDVYFVYTYLQQLNNEFNRLATGSTFREISKQAVQSVEISVPDITEQQKIGQFFKNLDSQIESEQKLLENYKLIKKSLLQKMFV